MIKYEGLIFNKFLAITAKPLTPPETMLLGSKNKLKATAIKKQPITNSK